MTKTVLKKKHFYKEEEKRQIVDILFLYISIFISLFSYILY